MPKSAANRCAYKFKPPSYAHLTAGSVAGDLQTPDDPSPDHERNRELCFYAAALAKRRGLLPASAGHYFACIGEMTSDGDTPITFKSRRKGAKSCIVIIPRRVFTFDPKAPAQEYFDGKPVFDEAGYKRREAARLAQIDRNLRKPMPQNTRYMQEGADPRGVPLVSDAERGQPCADYWRAHDAAPPDDLAGDCDGLAAWLAHAIKWQECRC